MGIETERKFLVTGDFLSHCETASRLTQGYLSLDPEKTVRVRTDGQRGWMTVKGISSSDGLSRSEWEYEIPYRDALQMLALPNVQSLSKVRYRVPFESYTFEVDVFLGMNQGLVIAEVEFTLGDQDVPYPSWCGDEVTGDARYYNSSLITNPYTKW